MIVDVSPNPPIALTIKQILISRSAIMLSSKYVENTCDVIKIE